MRASGAVTGDGICHSRHEPPTQAGNISLASAARASGNPSKQRARRPGDQDGMVEPARHVKYSYAGRKIMQDIWSI